MSVALPEAAPHLDASPAVPRFWGRLTTPARPLSGSTSPQPGADDLVACSPHAHPHPHLGADSGTPHRNDVSLHPDVRAAKAAAVKAELALAEFDAMPEIPEDFLPGHKRDEIVESHRTSPENSNLVHTDSARNNVNGCDVQEGDFDQKENMTMRNEKYSRGNNHHEISEQKTVRDYSDRPQARNEPLSEKNGEIDHHNHNHHDSKPDKKQLSNKSDPETHVHQHDPQNHNDTKIHTHLENSQYPSHDRSNNFLPNSLNEYGHESPPTISTSPSSHSSPPVVSPGLKVGRVRLELAAEFEVEHNWVRREGEERKRRAFLKTQRQLTIVPPDADTLTGIQGRLQEVQGMVKPRSQLTALLDDLPDTQRESLMKMASTDSHVLAKERKHRWKAIDRFRNAARLAFIIVCQCRQSRRYFNPEDPQAEITDLHRQQQLEEHGKQPIKSSLSNEMRASLTTHPDYRSNYDIKRVLWVLRATKAFRHLFPAQMERELARVVNYERYDDNRHIAFQGRCPQRFYFVLSGRVQLLKEYRLTAGCLCKSMGFWYKGMTSDAEEVEQGWLRESHVISKGSVELLSLHRRDFIRLQHTVQGPPVDFLRSIELFKEFPCDRFYHSPDAIEFKYYGQNRIIARDISTTPWLHIVKSGVVKVVRVQFVLDVRHDSKMAAYTPELAGCGRFSSHAQAMLGLLARQRTMDVTATSQFSLPKAVPRRSFNGPAWRKNGRRRNRLVELNERQREITLAAEDTDLDDWQYDPGEDSVHFPPISSSHIAPPTPLSPTQPGKGHTPNHSDVTPDMTQSFVITSAGSGTREGQAAMRRTGSSTHRAFLTREKTVADPEGNPRRERGKWTSGKRARREGVLRRAYLQLDLLQPGDVFGLDELAQKLRLPEVEDEEEVDLGLRLPGLENVGPPSSVLQQSPSISLVSDGAEVIRISKRFFLQHARNNTMLRVETLQRSYLSTEEAKTILYDKETWTQYKSILMQRLVAGLPR